MLVVAAMDVMVVVLMVVAYVVIIVVVKVAIDVIENDYCEGGHICDIGFCKESGHRCNKR